MEQEGNREHEGSIDIRSTRGCRVKYGEWSNRGTGSLSGNGGTSSTRSKGGIWRMSDIGSSMSKRSCRGKGGKWNTRR